MLFSVFDDGVNINVVVDIYQARVLCSRALLKLDVAGELACHRPRWGLTPCVQFQVCAGGEGGTARAATRYTDEWAPML